MNIVAAQLNPVIGDIRGNFQKIKGLLDTLPPAVNILVTPELALTGYPPNDLLLRKGFVDEQMVYLEELRKATISHPHVTLLVGAVTYNEEKGGKPLHNSAVAFRGGQEIFRYHKQLLPTYNIFDECRYFEPGKATQNTTLKVLVGDKVHNYGVLICEDCWNDEAITDAPLYATNPVKNAILGGETLKGLITLNASPSDIGKHYRRFDMYRTLAKKYSVPFLYVNSVGGQDSLIFDGHSFYTDGHNTQYSYGFIENAFCVNTTVNSPINMPLCDTNELIIQHLKLGIKDYVRKNGFKQVVVGSSGGIDSAVVLMLAVEALGKDNVFAVTMPSKFSSEGSVSDSVRLCKMLGIKLFTRPIGEEVELAIKNYEKSFGEAPKRLTIENLQARIRGRILMEYSNQTGALVLSTGNKSEMSVGYCTIYGDMCGGLSVIADLYKMEVYAIAKHYNKIRGEAVIPQAIIDKEPSAELWEGQKDTDSLPPYPVLDALLALYLERDLLSREEVDDCKEKISGMTLKEIKRILKMTDNAEFKRRQAAPVLRVHRRAFGFGRNLPITQRHQVSYESVI